MLGCFQRCTPLTWKKLLHARFHDGDRGLAPGAGDAGAGAAARPASASSQRAKAEAAHRKVMARREAESKVRACYFRFAGNCDVRAFMQALGYDMAASKDASQAAAFRTAVQVSILSLWHDGASLMACWMAHTLFTLCSQEIAQAVFMTERSLGGRHLEPCLLAQIAQTSRHQFMSQDKQILAEAAISKLQEWLAEVQKDGVMAN